ncbi:hypothetical protein sr10178 [Sporisorium reilianum SRZ2]|uniref:Secreted protein n=2 Tax=Sporisorium reilianum TaxID=72558 RepID=E6ZKP6_SPORE|nr:hypothetical protein sr10178 [Sporisorium reilianum SRZ2]SJX60537.1 uncharacterized protein SRS1_10178 [Sporisorium reilianum f. sp. reilianum]
MISSSRTILVRRVLSLVVTCCRQTHNRPCATLGGNTIPLFTTVGTRPLTRPQKTLLGAGAPFIRMLSAIRMFESVVLRNGRATADANLIQREVRKAAVHCADASRTCKCPK